MAVQILSAVLFTFCFMSLMWFWGKTRNNYGVIDVGWALVIAGILSIITVLGDSSPLAKLIFLSPIWIWAIRLSGYLYWTRIRTNHPEDKRYADFRKDYGDKVHQKFFTNVFLLQGGLALLLIGPAIAMESWYLVSIQDFTIGVYLGWAFFWIGVIGEALADQQLHSFISVPANKGKVCNVGLWRYTRHPNYFFEWFLWLGIALIPFRGPAQWMTFVSPLVMFILLRFISGVPFAERYSLKSKGDLFVAYQKTTNAFFPWFPKK
ncbi:hypothetical protein LPTSP4_35080 [Leptospira ryugenii]|uniref:Uncharacterized protein n=1 Tax=Leptospira ryugenii TaxID=1917863 RepID=A0A2P2E520_9LEPT|nr:DUF1295 domain-containing protein [Leptospira ryugenii]GBF51970.1 hypothetical protein LPTSP4_35080 [Leptospira ryugenii]